MFHRLVAPDPMICPVCHGMDWYYVETPGRNLPIEAELKRCQRPHADRVMRQNGTDTPMYPQQQTAATRR